MLYRHWLSFLLLGGFLLAADGVEDETGRDAEDKNDFAKFEFHFFPYTFATIVIREMSLSLGCLLVSVG
jgi:hypothetical protein